MARNERCLKCNRLKYHTGTGVGMAHPKCKCNNMTKETKRTNGGKPHVCGTIQVFNGGKDGITLCGKCNMPIDSIETPMEEAKHIVIDQAVEDLSGYYPTSNKLPNKEEVKELAHEMNIEVDLSPSDKTWEERFELSFDKKHPRMTHIGKDSIRSDKCEVCIENRKFNPNGYYKTFLSEQKCYWNNRMFNDVKAFIQSELTSATIKAKEAERERIKGLLETAVVETNDIQDLTTRLFQIFVRLNLEEPNK